MSRNQLPNRTRQAVYDRDGRRCVRCGTGRGLSVQHRQSRGMGGSRLRSVHDMSRLITLCGDGTRGCHGWVEAHPALAQAAGWSVPRWADASLWPVQTVHGWILLDNAGSRTATSRHPSDMDLTGAWPVGQRWPTLG